MPMVIGNLRCWVAGRTHRKGTQSQNVQIAHYFARQFYEQLLADLNRPGFELPPKSWTVTIPPTKRYFSAGTPASLSGCSTATVSMC